MTEEELKINKGAAEALGWDSNDDCTVYYRDHDLVMQLGGNYNTIVEDMHFHDSYDWAMLLVHRLSEIQRRHLKLKLHYLKVCMMTASALQITKACFEVLNDT